MAHDFNPNALGSQGGAGGVVEGSLLQNNYRYIYPNELNLKPGSTTHNRLKGMIIQRATDSRRSMESRYDNWNLIDETLTSFMPVTDKEQAVEDADRRKPIPIVIPLTYAVMETLLTYLTATFLNSPIFRYDGVGPEDTIGAMLLELVVAAQCRKAKVGLALHTMWRDSLAYGIGVVAVGWKVKEGFKRRRPTSDMVLLEDIPAESAVLFEGNNLVNIDPYLYLPDPNVPPHLVQEGEFVGWMDKDNRMSLLADEQTDDGIFNCQYLKHISGKSSLMQGDRSKRDKYSVDANFNPPTSTNPIDVIYMSVNLIPSEWKLGKSNYPEKWMFALAGDEVIIRADKLDLDHNMFPVAVAAPEYDGYSLSPISKLETVYGLQHAADFLYNSHITNVRKAINDMFVVDPSMINLNDMRNPSAGKLIRTRRKAWGRGVQNAVEQLKVSDITRTNVSDVTYISDMMEKISGATHGLQGLMRQTSERRSATEARDTRGSALSRLEKSARITSIQVMEDLAYIFASQTQQFMTEDQYVQIVGRSQEDLLKQFGGEDRVSVNPLALLVDYDVKSGDGSMPTSGDPQIWAQMIQVVMTNPELGQTFDVVRMFKHWASMTGAKNVEDFVKRDVEAQVLPDEEVREQAQAGNIVPTGGMV